MAKATATVSTPKAAATKAAPTPKAKAVAKTAPKAAAAPAKKDGLRKPQVRILAALRKFGKPMTRTEISEKAPVDVAQLVEYIGSSDDAKRLANDAKHFPSLVSLGLVKFANSEGTGASYEISAKGKTELEKAEKAAK